MPQNHFPHNPPDTVCDGQMVALVRYEGVTFVSLALHNAEPGTTPDLLQAIAGTLMGPERTREIALDLFQMADEAQRANEHGKEVL